MNTINTPMIIPVAVPASRAAALLHQHPLPERIVDEIKALSFALPIAFDPKTQKPYRPGYAQGAGCAKLCPADPLHQAVFPAFEPLLSEIQAADPRPLHVEKELYVTLLVQGNYLPEHDDIGGRVMPDGAVHHAAYSCLLYLESIEGGDLELAPKSAEMFCVQPANGQCVAFPAELKHRVSPVGERPRYAVILRVSTVEAAV